MCVITIFRHMYGEKTSYIYVNFNKSMPCWLLNWNRESKLSVRNWTFQMTFSLSKVKGHLKWSLIAYCKHVTNWLLIWFNDLCVWCLLLNNYNLTRLNNQCGMYLTKTFVVFVSQATRCCVQWNYSDASGFLK